MRLVYYIINKCQYIEIRLLVYELVGEFVIRSLKRSSTDSSILFHVYTRIYLIRSPIMYSYPCFCNATQYLHDDLQKNRNAYF